MSIYVTSDIHGHVHALDEALNAAAPGDGDVVYVLRDLVDRGPDPLGVISLVRSIPGVRVLLGNHERLMLNAIAATGDPVDGEFSTARLDSSNFVDWLNWVQNGGSATASQLETLDAERYAEMLAWVAGLPLYDVVRAGERDFILTHAGINSADSQAWRADNPEADLSDHAVLENYLAQRDEEELLWVRDWFWGMPTGLVDSQGMGPVVVAGHTPSIYLSRHSDDMTSDFMTEDGSGKIVELGARPETGGVADRIDIDCAAAAGWPVGRVGILRLDDREAWYADVREGE